MGAFSLRKSELVLTRSDFQRLSRCGRRLHRDHFVIVYCQNSLGKVRLGITVSKKVGRAVKRNRIKRLVRERFRLSRALFDDTYDINIIAKTGAAELSSVEITRVLEDIFRAISRSCKHEATIAGTH